MNNDGFNIDELLLEAQMLKDKQAQGDFPTTKEQSSVTQQKLDEALESVRDLRAEVKDIGFEEVATPIPHEIVRSKETVPLEPISQNITDSLEIEEYSLSEAIPESIPVQIQEDRPAPIQKPNKPKKKPKFKRNVDERVDLFDFRPEKREKPIVTGAFGQKHFVFDKADVPKPETDTHSEDSLELDFKRVADNTAEPTDTPTEPDFSLSDNPFEREFGTAAKKDLQKEQIKERYNKLAFGETAQETKPPAEHDGTQAFTGELPVKKKRPKSLFSTFATGTGREIDLEEIKKIDFSALEGAGGYYDDEDDVDNYASEIPDGSYVNFDEFSPKTDRQDVAKAIADTKLGILVRTGIISLVTIMLMYLCASASNINLPLPEFIFPTGSTLPTFLLTQMLLLVMLLIVCSNTAISGITSLFKMRANSDTLVTFSLISAAIQSFILFKDFRNFDVATITFIAPIASIVLLFNYIAKLGVLSRIQRNFRVVGAKSERKGISSISSPAYCREVLPKITESQPNIVYGAKGNFFTDFLALSFSTKYDVGINRAVAPVCLLGAVLVAIVTKFLLQDNILASTAFAAVISVCATLSTTFIESIPLSKVSRQLTTQGAMISGNKAVEDFSDVAGIVLTENDLFPRGHVYLNGIKAFPRGSIDQAILDAASVLCVLDGPLGHMFLEMIGGNRKLLKKVDNVVYENNMGLSGWVDGRRVLIGNRMLMQNHGIKLPNDSYEKAHPKDAPGNPVYVSNSGEVCARFLVEYTADESLAAALDQLAVIEKELIVYTTDSNITPKKVWEIYGYPVDLVTIMSSELQDQYREMVEEKDEMPAEIIYNGRPHSLIAALLAAVNARTAILIGTVFQLVQIAFGYTMVTLMAFTGALATFGYTKILIYLFVWFIVIVLAQQFRRS